MAHHVMSVELLDSSDDEENINIIPPLPPILLTNNNGKKNCSVYNLSIDNIGIYRKSNLLYY